jgi:general secretion pathway protein D
VLNNNIKFSLAKFSVIVVIGLSLASCAHQSKVKPSTGHIDSKSTAPQANQNAASSAPIPKLVRSAPQLPPPKATTKAQTYSVVVNEVPVKEILFALARESKINVDIHPAIQGRATLNAVDQTLPAILERLAKQVDLTYKMDGDTLYIAPDSPALRVYKVDYVNVSRTSSGTISAATEIESTGRGADIGSSSGGGAGGNNSSRASVTDETKNHFWENLEKNLKEILAETDKEVIITRAAGSASPQAATAQTAKKGASVTESPIAESAYNQDSQKALTEYKTLFAAQVIVNKEAGIISVRATNKQHEKVQEFLDKVLGSVKRQVLIEATIVEVELNDSYQFGIDWRLVSGDFSFNQLLAPNSLRAFSNIIDKDKIISNQFVLGVNTENLTAALHALEKFGNARVLSSPKMMAINNQPAILKVVNNLVYFTVKQDVVAGNTNTNSTVATTSTPHTVPVGVVMSVTPQISDTGEVTLLVRPTISRRSVSDGNPKGVEDPVNKGSFIPEIRVQEMESVLKVDSGQTAVLGGLMQDVVTTNTQGVPGISKIPYVGKLFESDDDQNTKTELVIFLRPTVITNASLESDELQSYKQYLPEQQLQNVLEDAN